MHDHTVDAEVELTTYEFGAACGRAGGSAVQPFRRQHFAKSLERLLITNRVSPAVET